MKNKRRQAFTIVELVIVIAVIAILSAVLIPTFGAIIRDANMAADRTAASTLTSELHVYLKGNQIKTEADLVDALNKSGIGEKLVPKADGVNFWFEMENQRFVAKELTELKTLTRNATPANTSFRDLYNKNLYLVDYYVLGEVFSTADIVYDVFSYIDDLATANQYANLIKQLGNVAEGHTYKEIATDILAKVHNTTIRTEAGAFFSAEGNATKFEYISAGATFIGNGYFKYDGTVKTATAAPAPVGPVAIPGHIDHIVEDGLNFDDTSAIIKIDRNRVNILAPGFTNANVLIGENTYKIDSENNPKEDELVNIADENDIIPLTVKLPFDEIVVNYDKDGAVNNVGDRIYVAFRNEVLRLNVANKNDITQVSNKVDKWELLDGDNNVLQVINVDTGIITLDNAVFSGNVSEFKVRATAKDKNENTITAEATIIVAKPVTATFTIYTNSGDITFTSNDAPVEDANIPQILFNGDITTYVTATSGNYGKDSTNADINAILNITPEISINHTNFTCEENGTKLLFNSTGVEISETFEFEVLSDDCLPITVKVKVVDASAALFQHNFYFDRNADKKYYLGSLNSFKLTDLYSATDLFGAEGGATSAKVTFYDKGSATGQLFAVNTANNDLDPYDITTYVLRDAEGNFTTDEANGTFVAEDSITITKEVMNNVVLKFAVEEDNSLNEGEKIINAYIEIVPNDNSVSTVILFDVVNNAKNATAINDLVAKDATGNVVAHETDLVVLGDITSVANADKIILDDQTLYGNGFIITATGYISNAGDTDLTDAFISGSNATIDNIYLDGPVYPVLNFDHNRNDFYVSGISLTGTSTIQNSYASGFRQPVCSSGSASTLTVKNTTLRGGNYANLLLKDGNLNLHNVTTIQDQGGIKNTVAYDDANNSKDIAVGGIAVTGMGIGLERPALDSTITITGYLDQYNWIKNGQSATLPSLSVGNISLNVNELFGFIFNGINEQVLIFNVTADMGSVKYFINQDTSMNATSRTDGYVHAGIVFGELGSDAPEWAEGVNVTINESGRTDGTIKKRTFDKLEMLFSKTGLERNGSFLFSAEDYFETDGLVVIWSHKDNRQWVPANMDYGISWSGITVKRLVNPTGGKVTESLPIYKLGDSTDYPINYNGYYKTSVYGSTYTKPNN